MAKYEFKIEIAAPAGQVMEEPTLEEVSAAIEAGLRAAYTADVEIRVYDGNRPDRD
jgi:hypothetical protein